jgi:hypothetical protein
MSKERPDAQDVELVLRVYELRREQVMRDARNAINGQFWPRTFEDILAIQKSEHPLNAPFRQVGTYWEMVYGIVKHGIVHADYFLESNAEGLYVFAKVAPFLERFRQEVSATGFRHAEWVSRETAEGRRLFELFTSRVKKVLENR